jgi:glycosyltransferase involved in cell wall biosynthesis
MISQSKKNLLEKKRAFTSLDDLTIVVPSIWLKNIVARSFLNKYPCVVINNGIDLNTFYIEKSSFREKYKIQYKKIILCISSIWSDRKGINDVFKLSSLLNENEIIILVGQVNHHLFKLPENIVFIKRTNSTEELREIYSSADVMFNPTYEDTYSNINMESISCGTPVVCYKTGGASEMLDSNFVVNQGSIIDALDVMRRIFKGELSINSQGKDFSHKKTIQEYEKIIIGNKVVIK